MKISIGRKAHFDAAHHLPNHEGKCHSVHGHTWHIEVEVTAPMLKKKGPETGMVMDLALLKVEMNKIIDKFDHQLLNRPGVSNPTCENLISLFYIELQPLEKLYKVEVTKIKIQEGEGGWAVWRA